MKLLEIFVLLFALEGTMSKSYLIETTEEKHGNDYFTNIRKVILIKINWKQITLQLHTERTCEKQEAE